MTMARKVAIVIGITKIKGLPELPGAVLGANNFATWATQQGYEVVAHTDDKGNPVAFQPIWQSVKSVVDAGDASRLLVYFSGHGLFRVYGMDYWLLSDAANNPNEAIAVSPSVFAAGACGIPHVAFIADACRTMAGKDQLGIQGSSSTSSTQRSTAPPRRKSSPIKTSRKRTECSRIAWQTP
jgi:hypothetical protein